MKTSPDHRELSNLDLSSKEARFLRDNSYLYPGIISEGRNAVAAKKIEEFVAPKLEDDTEKDKPKIGLIYGFEHLGLEYDLKSKRRRDLTLWNMRNLSFRKWSGIDAERLNMVYEARGVQIQILLMFGLLLNMILGYLNYENQLYWKIS